MMVFKMRLNGDIKQLTTNFKNIFNIYILLLVACALHGIFKLIVNRNIATVPYSTLVNCHHKCDGDTDTHF